MTTVSELFKNKGSPNDATKYRPISLVQLLAKLFDSILLERFKRWFVPADQQTAYQKNKSSADHVFLLRCMIQRAKMYKEKLFVIAVDFDGAFDRISRSILIRKLVLFGAGSIFITCLASIYMKTENIIFRHKDYMTYSLSAGIKQGLPLSPYIFLFYVNDIFDYFEGIYGKSLEIVNEIVHLLLHADDATLLASSRMLAVSKLRSLLQYCGINCIVPQYQKCEFIVIYGRKCDKLPMEFGEKTINHAQSVTLLGSHLSCSGNLADDLNLDFCSRFRSCIKYYNFIRSNRLAPLSVKFKVLKACVVSSLLYNCETFGYEMPKDLESEYYKLIKCSLNVRQNTPNLLTLIESGLLPLKSIILSRQYKFFKRFRDSLQQHSSRSRLFHKLCNEDERYIRHYLELSQKYTSKDEIYCEYVAEMKRQVILLAENGGYRFQTYLKFNPSLVRSPFIDLPHPLSLCLIKFRLGSHKLPIETGRWRGVIRDDRICDECGVLGDEFHFLYNCTQIKRDDLVLPRNIEQLWQHPNVFTLFSRLMEIDVL